MGLLLGAGGWKFWVRFVPFKSDLVQNPQPTPLNSRRQFVNLCPPAPTSGPPGGGEG